MLLNLGDFFTYRESNLRQNSTSSSRHGIAFICGPISLLHRVYWPSSGSQDDTDGVDSVTEASEGIYG